MDDLINERMEGVILEPGTREVWQQTVGPWYTFPRAVRQAKVNLVALADVLPILELNAAEARRRPVGFGFPWVKRWLVLGYMGRTRVLHRVAQIAWSEDEVSGEGTTVCGRKGIFAIPGWGARLGALRCAYCCRRLGIPRGYGAPKNDRSLSPEQQEM